MMAMTSSLLEDVCRTVENERQPETLREASSFLCQLTDGKYTRIWTPLGVPLPFMISELDQGRTWAWNVAGVPATRHGVEPLDDGSRVWMSAPVWAPAYLPVLSQALRRIDAMSVQFRTG